MTAIGERPCACGCGGTLKPATHRAHAIYMNGACRARASRNRAAKAANRPAPRPRRQRRSRDVRVNYARAIESVGAWLQTAWPTTPELARGMARHALRDALPPRLRTENQ
jgi:hypothetical protein